MYIINKSDGNIAATVNEGVVDTNYTDLYLVGKNYQAYGQLINTNFVRLLENFSDNSAPTHPITGQLWYDTVSAQLYQYNGLAFKNLNSVAVKSSSPDHVQTGDLWYDTVNKQLKFYTDINTWQIVAPVYSNAQGTSGQVVTSVNDALGNAHTLTHLYDGGTSIAVLSKDDFTPNPSIPGYSDIMRGINLSALSKLQGTATNSDNLANLDVTSFMRTDGDTLTSGTLTVLNDDGVNIGAGNELYLYIDGSDAVIENAVEGNLIFNVTDSMNNTFAAMIMNSDMTITSASDLLANNLSSAYDTQVGSNLSVSGSSAIDGDLSVGGNFDVTADGTAQNFIAIANVNAASITADTDINTVLLNADAISVGTGSGDAIAVDGNVALQGDNTIYFQTGVANAHVSGEFGTLALGAGGEDWLTIQNDGTISFLGPVDFTDVTINAYQMQVGSIYHHNRTIQQTIEQDDLELKGGPNGGYVTADNFYVSGANEAEVLHLYSTNQSTAPTNGSMIVDGGAGIARDLNVGGNISVSKVLSTIASKEQVQIVTAALTGATNVDILSGGTKYYTTDAAGNWTPNFRASSTVALNDIMNVGDNITCSMITTQGATPYFTNSVKVDGNTVTSKWLAFNPDAGNGSSLDVYSYAIIKTGNNQWMVLAGLSNFV